LSRPAQDVCGLGDVGTIRVMRILGLDARRLGSGLVAFGLVGVVIGALAAIALGTSGIAARSLEDRLVAGQASLANGLTQASESVGQAATAMGNLQATILTTQKTLTDTSDALTSFADTSDALAQGLGFSVLGQQPLAGAATQFAQLSVKLRTFAADAEALSTNLSANATDLEVMSAQLTKLQSQLSRLGQDLAASNAAGGIATGLMLGTLLGAALCAWVAGLAGFLAWLGLRLRRVGTGEVTPGA
jgi:hypothetical protein